MIELFKTAAAETLSLILHNYSHFSISTIDAFFQRIIRSFHAQAGDGNFRLRSRQWPSARRNCKAHYWWTWPETELTEWVVGFSKSDWKKAWWNITYALVWFCAKYWKRLQTNWKISCTGRTRTFYFGCARAIMTKLQELRHDLVTPATQAVQILQQWRYHWW